MKDIQAEGMTIRFESEVERHDGIERDRPIQHFASDHKRSVQAEKARKSDKRDDTATRHKWRLIDIASLARIDILVVRRSRSLPVREYLVDRCCRSHRIVLGWEPNAKWAHGGRWIRRWG